MENEFYRSEILQPAAKGLKNRWRAKSVVIRKDSNEKVYLLALSAKSREDLDRLMNETFEKKVIAWGKPGDWPRTPVTSRLIDEYLDFAGHKTNHFLDWKSLEPADRTRWANRINALAPVERLALVRQTPEQREGCGRFFWATDETVVKHWLYQYIAEPTPEERVAHQELLDSWLRFCGTPLADLPYPKDS